MHPAAVFAAMQAFLGLATFVDLDFDAAGHRRSADLPYNMSSARYQPPLLSATSTPRRATPTSPRAGATSGAPSRPSATRPTRQSRECYIFMQDPPALSRTSRLDAVATRTFPVREPP